MKLNFAIEASRPCGTTFRLSLGAAVPWALVLMVFQLAGLF